MKNKIVVENTLTTYIEYLKSCGYDVYTLYRNDNINNIVSDEYKAIIVSGLDVLGTRDTSYENPPVPIIEARGHTPEEIYHMLENRYS